MGTIINILFLVIAVWFVLKPVINRMRIYSSKEIKTNIHAKRNYLIIFGILSAIFISLIPLLNSSIHELASNPEYSLVVISLSKALPVIFISVIIIGNCNLWFPCIFYDRVTKKTN